MMLLCSFQKLFGETLSTVFKKPPRTCLFYHLLQIDYFILRWLRSMREIVFKIKTCFQILETKNLQCKVYKFTKALDYRSPSKNLFRLCVGF